MNIHLMAKEPNVLLVEDNPIDVLLTKQALKTAGFLKEPTVVDDGVPALSLLRREEAFAAFPFPDLVILDLNLKKVDGPEVLAYIRHEPDLSSLCVVILSSSPADVMAARASGAHGYFSKPSDLASYLRLGKEILDCYLAADLTSNAPMPASSRGSQSTR